MYALRCAVNHTMRASPGELVFRRDILMDAPVIVNREAIRGRRQKLIDNNLLRINQKRIDHNFSVGDMVLTRIHNPDKLQDRFDGPFRIARVYTNGTCDLEMDPITVRRYNIRKLVPVRVEQNNQQVLYQPGAQLNRPGQLQQV